MLRKILRNIFAILRVYFSRDIFVVLDEIRRVRGARLLADVGGGLVTNLPLPVDSPPTNSCVLREEDHWLVAVRAVNYKVTPVLGRLKAPNGNQSVDSRNWLLRLDDNLRIHTSVELDDSPYRGPQSLAKNGLEDPRLFHLNGRLWGLWTAGRVPTDDWENVTNTMALGRIEGDAICDLTYLASPHQRRREKNWMPWVIRDSSTSEDELRLIYEVSTMETYRLRTQGLELIHKSATPDPRLKGYSGGSALIPFRGGYLCAVHYAARATRMASAKLAEFFYIQRLVHVAADHSILALSREFFFEHRGTEFCAGIAIHEEHLLLSYSIRDSESHIMSLGIEQVDALFGS